MNILKDRLKNIEESKTENIFKHKMNKILRNGSGILNVEPFYFKSFNFNGNLHSNKLEEEQFTNYISSYDNKYYKILTKIFDKLNYDDYEFFDEFELDEYISSEYTEASKRLKRIIMEVNGIKDDRLLPQIDKFKPTKHMRKEEKRFDEIRLYVSKDNVGNIDLYLVDLYHLGIDAFNYKLGKNDLKGNYRAREKYNYCISKIADKYVDKEK